MTNQPVPSGFVRNLAGELHPVAILNDGMQRTSSEPRFLVVMGYYHGDLARVIRTCEIIADLEPDVNPVADFLLWGRFDATGFPDDTLARLRAKFQTVHVQKSGRHGATGFPYGANEMWHDLVHTMSGKAWSERYYAFFNMEWDAVPLRRGWIQELDAAWKAAKAQGKAVLGVHQTTPALHVNGVAVYDTKLAALAPNARLGGCNPQGAYDVEHRDIIVPMSKNTGLIKLDYRRATISAAELLGANDGRGPCVHHGVQDSSAIDAVRDEIVLGKARAQSKAVVFHQNFPVPPGFTPVTATISTNQPHYLFIRSYTKDFPFLKYCLQSVAKFASGFVGIKVVVPQTDAATFTDAGVDFTVCEADPCKGYLAQQITKLYADKFLPDDGWVSYIDSDCIFTDAIAPADFFHGGKPIALYQSYAELKEQVPWKESTEKALGFTVENELMRRHGATYHTSELAEFRQWFLSNRGVTVRDYIIAEANAGRCLAEFNLMGAWLFRYKHGTRAWFKTEKYEAPRLPLSQFWSWGGIETARAQIESLLGIGDGSTPPPIEPTRQPVIAPVADAAPASKRGRKSKTTLETAP